MCRHTPDRLPTWRAESPTFWNRRADVKRIATGVLGTLSTLPGSHSDDKESRRSLTIMHLAEGVV
ncbi:MAG: hypothetical protein R3C56_32480 [Pirellulaceae bacterium]